MKQLQTTGKWLDMRMKRRRLWRHLSQPVHNIMKMAAQPILKRYTPYLQAEVRQGIRDERIREYSQKHGLTPVGLYEEDDIFIIEYPKSGITWLQSMIVALVYGLDLELMPYRFLMDIVPEIDQIEYYRRYQTPMFFKSHILPQPYHKRVIYLIRDGRDAVVSLAHFRHHRGDSSEYWDIATDMAQLQPYLIWHEHVEAWLSNPYDADMLVVRYEDMLSDTKHEMQRVCKFMGIQRESATISNVVEKASFNKMRQREEQYGMHIVGWPSDARFVRRGISGSYKNEMPRDILDIFMSHAGSTLAKLGYDVEE